MEDKLSLKQQLFEECLRMQRSTVQTAKEAIDELMESANANTDTQEEVFDSYREQIQHTRDMYVLQMQTAQNELLNLQQTPANDLTPTIEPGAVVRTDKQNFFISISLGEVKVADQKYFAISTSAPIFQAMVSLRQGDSFTFRDRDYKILEVF